MDPASERNAALSRLQSATSLLDQSLNPALVPQGGAQIGYAIRGARDKNGVAAIEGRISGPAAGETGRRCSYGTDEEIARVILTVMKFDPARRSAAILRFSQRALAVFEGDLFLECAPVDTAKAPKGISTMDWGIAACCREEVPDVIYPRGPGAESAPLILLGEEPVDVANNIIICSNRI